MVDGDEESDLVTDLLNIHGQLRAFGSCAAHGAQVDHGNVGEVRASHIANLSSGPCPSKSRPGQTGFMSDATLPTAVNLAEKLAQFDERWSPRTVATFNGHDVMVVKVKGEFVWHHHDDTDDFFLVLSGQITIRMHEGDVTLGSGELFVVPVGVEHQPFAEDEASVLLIEPTGTPNTGDESTAARRVEI